MNVHVIIIIVIRKFIDVNLNESDYYKIMNPSHTIVIITKTKINNILLISRPELYYVLHLLVRSFLALLKMYQSCIFSSNKSWMILEIMYNYYEISLFITVILKSIWCIIYVLKSHWYGKSLFCHKLFIIKSCFVLYTQLWLVYL